MLKFGRISFLLALSISLSACGGLRGKVRGEGGLANIEGQGGILGATSTAPVSVDPAHYSETLDGEVLGVKLKNKSFDIPVVYNKEVEKWMRFFTERGREHFEIYLERMGAMIPLIIPQLRKAGMPEDLIFLSMIESGFSMRAKSHAGAVGPWQFIRSTGRIYSMRIDPWMDERRDPVHATRAATEYLRNLYEEFGAWELAAAAYNSGEVRIRNAIAKYGTRDFWEIARQRRALRRETKDYVPKMMAAAILAKNAELFGFKSPEPDPRWVNTVEVKIPKAEDLRTIAQVASVDTSVIQQLNPELLNSCTPPGAYSLRIPKETQPLVVAAIENGQLGHYENFRHHKIVKGDSLSRIARRFRVSKDVILALNNLPGPWGLRLGQELVIPGSALDYSFEREPRVLAARGHRHHHRSSFRRATASTYSDSGAVIYTVQKGDTLYDISRRYSVSVNDIKDWNDISRTKHLQPGRRLKLYVRNERI